MADKEDKFMAKADFNGHPTQAHWAVSMAIRNSPELYEKATLVPFEELYRATRHLLGTHTVDGYRITPALVGYVWQDIRTDLEPTSADEFNLVPPTVG